MHVRDARQLSLNYKSSWISLTFLPGSGWLHSLIIREKKFVSTWNELCAKVIYIYFDFLPIPCFFCFVYNNLFHQISHVSLIVEDKLSRLELQTSHVENAESVCHWLTTSGDLKKWIKHPGSKRHVMHILALCHSGQLRAFIIARRLWTGKLMENVVHRQR